MAARLGSASRLVRAALVVATLAAPDPGTSAATEAAARTLIIVLDGVPYRVAERAVAEGAFADWPPPARLVGPFPSMTNPSLTLLLSPLGVPPAPGYELQHYDWEANRIHGGGAFEYRNGTFPWRSYIQAPTPSLAGKFGTYARPRRHFERDLRWAEEVVFADERDVVILHVGALDALQHLEGDAATLPLVKALHAWSRGLAARHELQRGQPLRFVLLSDHGNSAQKIRRLFRGRDLLRRAGLRVRRRLERPGDVVVGTFGVNGHVALYVDDAHAETAGRAMVAHPGIDLAAWRVAPDELRIAGDDGDATVRWAEGPFGRRVGYDPGAADPLALSEALARLRGDGQVGDDGLAPEDAWLAATATASYPDAPVRLVDGLTGTHVVNRATVLLSLEPGWAWGWKSAATFAWFRGGALEGTHGGLDRESSLGFLLASDPSLVPGLVVRSDAALVPSLSGAHAPQPTP